MTTIGSNSRCDSGGASDTIFPLGHDSKRSSQTNNHTPEHVESSDTRSHETSQEGVPVEVDVSFDIGIHQSLDTAFGRGAAGVISDTEDESNSDESSYTKSSSQESLLDHDDDTGTPITSMEQLVERFFGSNGACRPRYSYAQARIPPQRQNPATLSDSHVAMLTHDCVLHFLAPHEILALWKTNKTTWHAMVPKQRMFVMMRSVFSYLRISEEAAQHVHKLIIGGWNAYCPLLVMLCEHLARIYGHFEVDTAHRTFMAHQACFFPKSRGFWRCGSGLAEHEVRLARVLDFRDRHVINYSQPTSKLPPPTLDVLKMDSLIGWGDAQPFFERERVGARQSDKRAAKRTDALTKHHSWMLEHAKEAPNAHYRLRLERALSPCIWVDKCGVRLSPSSNFDLELWALGIGSKRQQFLRAVSTRDFQDRPCSFADCLEYDPTNGSCLRGGFMELILRRSHSTAFNVDHEYDRESWPTLGILIWCKRQGLEPLTDSSIDWEALIDDVCRRDSEMFRRFYREGLIPWDPFGPHAPRPDPVDTKFIEREKRFYMESLTSPLFGPADFRTYI